MEKVYIVLDLEEVPKHCVHAVCLSLADAEKAEKELQSWHNNQRITRIIDEPIWHS